MTVEDHVLPPFTRDIVDQFSLARTATLLAGVFGPAIGNVDYLRWLYSDNPAGRIIAYNCDVDGRRIGHYALMPTLTIVDGRAVRTTFSLNTAVDANMRMRGLFSGLAEATFDAAEHEGVECVFGVGNAASTPGFIRRLAFRDHGMLPARVSIAARYTAKLGQDAEVVGEDLLGDAAFRDHVARVLEQHNREMRDQVAPLWSEDLLLWRLRRPGANYRTFSNGNNLVVLAKVRVRQVPVAVLLKVFAPAVTHEELRSLGVAAAGATKCAAVIGIGETSLAVRGRSIAIPNRLRPSPLQMISRRLHAQDEADETWGESIKDNFAPLDFDPF